VLIDLDADGAKAFEQLTRKMIGKKIAIVVDDRVKSAPIVMSEIPGGRISITMGGNQLERQQQEANELAIALASGALPSPLREESVVELAGGVPQPVPEDR
jgi:SecD/SecF fusion protein